MVNKTIFESLGFGESDGIDEIAATLPGSPLPAPNVSGFIDVPSDSPPDHSGVQEASFNSQEVHDTSKNSLDFLAALAVPTIFRYCFPPVFQSVWQWLLTYVNKTRDFSQLALGLPRGFGKTTLIKIFILYCILFTSKRFILVVSSTATLAEAILSDIIDMLEEPNIKKVFGDWKLGIEKDTQAIKKFGFRGRNITLAGLGAGTSLRGLNIKNERPDVMVFEDIQTRECADSDIQSDNLEKWMIGTAMKAKSPHGCLFIFIANMYPTKWSILRRLKQNKTWIKFIAGGILSDGTSLWEDLQPIAQLTAEFENDLAMGRPEIFYAEVLNDENASSNSTIDLSLLPTYPYQDDDISAGSFIIIDPSSGKVNSDSVAIGYCEIHNGYPVLMELVNDRLSPGETIHAAIKLCLKHGCTLIGIESVAYQSTLSYWFQFICQQVGVMGIEAVEVYPGGYSKNSRILSMFNTYRCGEIWVHPDLVPVVHLQIVQWNPLRRDNIDDVLDLLAYMPKMLELYGAYIVSRGIIEDQDYQRIEVLEYNAAF